MAIPRWLLRRKVLATVRDLCGKKWAEKLHLRIDEALSGKVDDKAVQETIEAAHAVVCRLGGPRGFARLLHAAILDRSTPTAEKARLLALIGAMWALTGSKLPKEWAGKMSDGEMAEWLAKFERRVKVRKTRAENKKTPLAE